MDLVATQNFRSVERFLNTPDLDILPQTTKLGHDDTRLLLRHFAGEQNRFYFEQWEWMELGLGLGLVLFLVFGAKPPKVPILLAIAMLIIVLGQRIGLTPQISKLGRVVDFIPPNTESHDRTVFWTLHGIYSGVELLKLGIGIAIAGVLVIRPKPDPRQFARESNLDESTIPRRRPA